MTISRLRPQQNIGLTPSSTAWIDAIAQSLNIDDISSTKSIKPSINLDLSKEALNSISWNNKDIDFLIINKNVQSYTKDLKLIFKIF